MKIKAQRNCKNRVYCEIFYRLKKYLFSLVCKLEQDNHIYSLEEIWTMHARLPTPEKN